MGIGAAAETADFSKKPEKKFYIAPQPTDTAVATTAFQSLHYVDFNLKDSQDSETDNEYGGEDGSLDASDVALGDIRSAGDMTTRLCLNEIGFHLAHAYGAPATSGAGPYVHVFNSGAARLPLATSVLEDGTRRQTGNSVVYGGIKVDIDRGAAFQKVGIPLFARQAAWTDSAALAGVDTVAAVARLFVPKNGWVCKINDVAVGKLITAGVDYQTPVNEDRYVGSSVTADALWVGERSCTNNLVLRHLTQAQLVAFDNPFKMELIGTDATGMTMSILTPRVIAPKPDIEEDGLLYRAVINGTASKTEGGSPLPMQTVTLTNGIATY